MSFVAKYANYSSKNIIISIDKQEDNYIIDETSEVFVTEEMYTIINNIMNEHNYHLMFSNIFDNTISSTNTLNVYIEANKDYYFLSYFDKIDRVITGTYELDRNDVEKYSLDKFILCTERVYEIIDSIETYSPIQYCIDNSIYYATVGDLNRHDLEGNSVTENVNSTDKNDTLSLNAYKNYILTEALTLLKQYEDSDFYYESISFILTNNELINRGYVITESNKEEKYQEALESGDDSLYQLINTYITIQTNLQRLMKNYSYYNDFKRNIISCRSNSEVDEEYTTYKLKITG